MDSASTDAGCLLDHSSHCGPYAELTGAYWLEQPSPSHRAEDTPARGHPGHPDHPGHPGRPWRTGDPYPARASAERV
jgi:hypothetical protein